MAKTNEDETDEQEENRHRSWNFGNFGGRPGPQGIGLMRSQFGHHRGWLRPAILKLLQDKPMNGMEMMNRFSEASHGWWKPSPGSVYPLLETLETEGMIKKNKDGRYEVTKKFASQFGPIGQVDEVLTNMEGSVSYFEDMVKTDKGKLSPYKKRIEKITERLSKIK